MIIQISGHKRAGKTLFTTLLGYGYYKKGWDVYSNFWLKFPHIRIESFSQLIGLHPTNSVLLFDEFHIWTDSRESASKKNKVIGWYVSNTGKDHVHLIFNSHRLDQVDKRIRRLTDMECYVSWLGNLANPSPTDLIQVDMLDFTRQALSGEPEHRVFIVRPNPVFNLYNTHEYQSLPEEDEAFFESS